MDAEDLTEEARANPEHLLVESFFHAETTYDVGAESLFITEAHNSVARYDEGSHITPYYLRTMEVYVVILIKTTQKHGGQPTRQLMNQISPKLIFSLKLFFNIVKIIPMYHKISHQKSINCSRRKYVFVSGHDQE